MKTYEKLKNAYLKMAKGEYLTAERFINVGDFIIHYELDKISISLPSMINPLKLSFKCFYHDTDVDGNNHILMIMDGMKELAMKNAIQHINLIKEGKNADK